MTIVQAGSWTVPNTQHLNWLQTVSGLLIEILLVMKLDDPPPREQCRPDRGWSVGNQPPTLHVLSDDAYSHVDRLLTVLLRLTEILLIMKLDDHSPENSAGQIANGALVINHQPYNVHVDDAIVVWTGSPQRHSRSLRVR